jgi:deaminated glutathione amidase
MTATTTIAPPAPLLAAVVQLSSQGDVQTNVGRALALVEAAAAAGAELVALPENFAFMGEEDDKRRIAEQGDGSGPILRALSECARRCRAWIVAGGMPERSADAARPYNTSFLVGPDGNIAARYRKVHLFDVEIPHGPTLRESNATTPGETGEEDVALADVRGVPVGMTVCYDLRFPELYRRLATLGARVVTVPAAFTLTTGKDHWHVLLRARAIEDQVFVLAPAQHGTHPRGRKTYGKSMIVDPWGDVIAQHGESEGFSLARLDFSYQDRVRAGLPCMTHRRLG